MGSGSAWTARVLGATTSSSSGSGDRSSTRRSTSELTAPSPRPVLRSAGISTSTTHADRIRALTGGRRIEPTSPSCRRSRRPEPGRPSTYQSGKPVPTNRASSSFHEFGFEELKKVLRQVDLPPQFLEGDEPARLRHRRGKPGERGPVDLLDHLIAPIARSDNVERDVQVRLH